MIPENGGWLSKEEIIFQRMEHFHRQRVEQLEKEGVDRSQHEAGAFVVHMIPQESVERRIRIPASDLKSHGREIRPLGEGYGQERFNADGYRHLSPNAYSQLFRDGRMEAVSRSVTYEVHGGTGLRLVTCEQALLKIVPAFVDFCRNAKLSAPVWVFTALIGCDQTRIRSDPQSPEFSENALDRSSLFLPEVEMPTLDVNVDEILRPLCDALWQAFGIEHSPNFGDDGKWRPRR